MGFLYMLLISKEKVSEFYRKMKGRVQAKDEQRYRWVDRQGGWKEMPSLGDRI